MASAQRRVAWGGEADFCAAAGLDLVDEQLRKLARFHFDLRHRDAVEGGEPCFKRREGEDGGRAGEEAQDAVDGPVIVVKGEGLGVAHPALQWVLELVLEPLC